jgi:hypothetical protein
MSRLALVLVLASHSAAAEPPLGQSSRMGRAWWDDSSALVVTPVWVADRHGHPFVYDWEVTLGSVEIDHDRFYELVGRPDLVRAAQLRIGLGALAIVGGIAAGVLGTKLVVADGHMAGLALLGGGMASVFTGAYLVLEPDPISASEAQQLASDRAVLVGYGGSF